MAERKKQSKTLLHGKKDDYKSTLLVVMSVNQVRLETSAIFLNISLCNMGFKPQK